MPMQLGSSRQLFEQFKNFSDSKDDKSISGCAASNSETDAGKGMHRFGGMNVKSSRDKGSTDIIVAVPIFARDDTGFPLI